MRAVFVQVERAERAAHADNAAFFQAAVKQLRRKQAAFAQADVKFQRAGFVRRIGDGIAAAAVFEQDFHILAGMEHERRRFGQCDGQHGHVAAGFDVGNACGQGADG